jgi:beta-lactamase class A
LTRQVQADLDHLTHGFRGRVGVCAQDASGALCLRADERFPLQSVIKLFVAIAVMDAGT